MSKRSRARTHTRQAKKLEPYCLDKQKLTARQAALDSRIWAILFPVLVLVTLVIGVMEGAKGRVALWGLVVLIPVWTVCIVKAIRRHRLDRALQRILCSDVTETDIHCTKVRFMTQKISKYSSVIFCILLYDAKGEAFFYVYPEGDERYDHEAGALRSGLVGYGITLACYAGTHIVKDFKNKHN